jgi:hypothetical protein
MSERILLRKSPRFGLPFDRVPTVRGSMYGGSIIRHYPDSYGAILDCVYEMADQVMTSNAIPAAAAIERTLQAEGWRLLPRHKKMIIEKLETP